MRLLPGGGDDDVLTYLVEVAETRQTLTVLESRATQESVADAVEGRLLKCGRSIVRIETNAVRDTQMINIKRATSNDDLDESVGTRRRRPATQSIYSLSGRTDWKLGTWITRATTTDCHTHANAPARRTHPL